MFKKILLSSLLIYTIVGFFVLPYILKPQIIQIVEKETNSKLYIKNIYFNPFIFNLKISGIKLKSLDSKPLVSLKSIKFDLELYSLFNSTIHIKQFVLEEPKISIIYEKNKSLNLLKIFKPSEKSTESDSKSELSIPRILIDRIAIVKGKVDYEDYSHKTKFDFSFNDIGFEVKDIDTDKLDTPSAKFRFYTTLGDGGFVDLRGETLGMKPLKMKGNLNFEASKLYTQWRYLQDNLNLEVADGKLALYADYNFNLDSLDDMMIENYRFSLEKLRIKPKNQYNDVFYLNNFHSMVQR